MWVLLRYRRAIGGCTVSWLTSNCGLSVSFAQLMICLRYLLYIQQLIAAITRQTVKQKDNNTDNQYNDNKNKNTSTQRGTPIADPSVAVCLFVVAVWFLSLTLHYFAAFTICFHLE